MQPETAVSGLRFAFYGRTSTTEFQGPVTSRAWQREMAASVISGHGAITREFFDVGCSRRVPWVRRPQAAALLEQAQGPSRGFDAVVVGEFERAFADRQFHEVAALLAAQGVAVWLPETSGPVDLTDPDHRVLMQVLAAQSQREVVRSRHRTLAAMTAQTVEQGRFLGGRPPYGYRLVDAGAHPNRAHAAWGRRQQRLDPDPVTARHVRWIFAERLAGRSVAGIARELNERGVACPSAADPGRNRHRSGQAWNLRSVAVILANPRYTGREVWRRNQCATPGGGRRVLPAEWAISASLAHPALVTEADFVAVQQIRAARVTDDGVIRRYLLAGLIRCGLCGRLLDAHWVNGRAGYRCRHGHNSARPAPPGRPKNLYVREDHLLTELSRRQLVDGDAYAPNALAAVALLRSQTMVIEHDRTGWRVAACDAI
ncbi:MAG: recombinase family protein [Pseudonocardia sp.]|nr:recombinase family protein [Pseudonocardia sp.]